MTGTPRLTPRGRTHPEGWPSRAEARPVCRKARTAGWCRVARGGAVRPVRAAGHRRHQPGDPHRRCPPAGAAGVEALIGREPRAGGRIHLPPLLLVQTDGHTLDADQVEERNLHIAVLPKDQRVHVGHGHAKRPREGPPEAEGIVIRVAHEAARRTTGQFCKHVVKTSTGLVATTTAASGHAARCSAAFRTMSRLPARYSSREATFRSGRLAESTTMSHPPHPPSRHRRTWNH